MLVQGVQAIAKAAPAISGPPRPARRSSDSECHSRLSTRTNGVARNSDAHRDDQHAPDLLERLFVVVERRADHRRAHAQQDEDRREARDEQQARDEHAAGADALLQVGRRDPDDGREVAGHERQHARREERHEAGGERDAGCPRRWRCRRRREDRRCEMASWHGSSSDRMAHRRRAARQPPARGLLDALAQVFERSGEGAAAARRGARRASAPRSSSPSSSSSWA